MADAGGAKQTVGELIRRPRGEPAKLILGALQDANQRGFGDMTIQQLREATELPIATIQDNLKVLRKSGTVRTYKDDDRLLWVRLTA